MSVDDTLKGCLFNVLLFTAVCEIGMVGVVVNEVYNKHNLAPLIITPVIVGLGAWTIDKFRQYYAPYRG